MRIERLGEDAWERLRAVRLAALAEAPDAFGTTHAECLTWSPARWRGQLRTLATFVATSEAADVGMVRGAHHEGNQTAAYLISMWVAPQARRRGVGAALVDAIAHWARGLSKTELLLDVREHNHGAIALYEHKGFVATGKATPEPPPHERIIERQFRLSLGPRA